MNNWKILHRIITGDLRPFLVNSRKEIAVVEEIMNTKKPEDILGELIDLEFPSPIGKKSEIYYWLIKYETRAIEDDLKNLLVEIPEEEQLHWNITRHFLYGMDLKEKSKIMRLRINEAPEAKQIDEDCYVLACCETYIHQLLNDLWDFYLLILPPEKLEYIFLKLNSGILTQISTAEKQLDSIINQKRKNDVPLFKFSLPNDKQEKFLEMLYLYLKEKKYIDADYLKFKRHFFPMEQDFERLVWKQGVTKIKYIFHYLIIKDAVLEPEVNLNHLLHLHFINRRQEPIDENHLSQSLSRLRGSDDAIQIEKDLDLMISNFKSN